MFARACSIAADQARRLELRPGARSLPQRPRMTSEAPRLLRQPLESATGHLQRTLPPGKCATRVDTGAETRPGQARRARGISLPVGLVPRRLTDLLFSGAATEPKTPAEADNFYARTLAARHTQLLSCPSATACWAAVRDRFVYASENELGVSLKVALP